MPRATTHAQYFTEFCFETPLKNYKRVPGVRIDSSLGVIMAPVFLSYHTVRFLREASPIYLTLELTFRRDRTET